MSKTGQVPSATAGCVLVVSPGFASTYPCRARLSCAGNVLYGDKTSGFLPCSFDDKGEPTGWKDEQPSWEDTDPMFTVDLLEGTARLSDSKKGGTDSYTVLFKLE